jgi:hypothetical protein
MGHFSSILAFATCSGNKNIFIETRHALHTSNITFGLQFLTYRMLEVHYPAHNDMKELKWRFFRPRARDQEKKVSRGNVSLEIIDIVQKKSCAKFSWCRSIFDVDRAVLLRD